MEFKLHISFIDKIEYARVQFVARFSAFTHKQNNEAPKHLFGSGNLRSVMALLTFEHND
jgi:hypothetical protein